MRGRVAAKPFIPPQSTRFRAGQIATLPIERETEFGYFVTDGEVDILLHKNEVTEPVRVGDEVKVFFYHDHENRLSATMRMPIVTEGRYDWLEVVEVNPRMGVFLNNGTQKDLLLFMDDLSPMREEWPQKGDKVYVTLKHDKYGRLLADPAVEDVIWDASRNAGEEMRNQWVDGRVYRVIREGAFVFTDAKYIMFIHRDEMVEPLRMGQQIRARVTYVREDGRLNGSVRLRKEHQYGEDAKTLLTYLAERGAMPFNDKTDPEIIKDKFNMSKGAFKRALGKLMKEGLIEQDEEWTHLKREAYLSMQAELEQEETHLQ